MYKYRVEIPVTAQLLIINQLDFTGGVYIKIPVGLVTAIELKLRDQPDWINNKHARDGGTWIYAEDRDNKKLEVSWQEL